MTVLDAQGAVFTFQNGASTPVVVNGVTAWTGFDGVATTIDVTTLASSAKEWRQGLQDYGKISFTLMRDPNDLGQKELEIAKAAQATRICTLTLRSGDVATFSAFVISITADGAVDKVVTGKTDLKITGPVVWS